ncbi:MAG: methylenetetrahydromethanopterin dehydrogenase [Burkholderiaceae bacterium]|nr:methylenetetrahydromethanopterin dehydrogenase [Burkholderiaceae bacterium]
MTTHKQHILHLFTPGRQVSPFDVNMAIDAGYPLVVPYAEVDDTNVVALTQDVIFSRGPKGAAYSAIFIGGRDVVLAADMLESARRAMVPPFAVSVFADPSGAYTTAAALIACVERALRRAGQTTLAGLRVLILGGTGAVGRAAAVLADQCGARSVIASHTGPERARSVAEATNRRFGTRVEAVGTDTTAALRAAVADADVVLATAAAGVQVMSDADVAAATRLRVAADVNAVPPSGIAGLEMTADGVALPGSAALGIGALAIGNVKYRTQQRMFVRMRESGEPLCLGLAEALATAREILAA